MTTVAPTSNSTCPSTACWRTSPSATRAPRRWRAVAATRGVEAVGDARSAEKDNSYVPMADTLGVRFTPFVLYTYGGFHKSALSTVEQLAAASDPAVALVSLSDWKADVKNRIAVCVQRHTANIVIDDDRRARSAGVLTRRRRPGRRPAARRRPHLSETLLRRPVANVGHEQPAMSRRGRQPLCGSAHLRACLGPCWGGGCRRGAVSIGAGL